MTLDILLKVISLVTRFHFYSVLESRSMPLLLFSIYSIPYLFLLSCFLVIYKIAVVNSYVIQILVKGCTLRAIFIGSFYWLPLSLPHREIYELCAPTASFQLYPVNSASFTSRAFNILITKLNEVMFAGNKLK